MRLKTLLAALVFSLAVGCSAEGALLPRDPNPDLELGDGVNGTVVWMGIEGGFWAIRTDDGRTLDPHASLPAAFRVNNLAVRVQATVREDRGCIHMAGLIVDITNIQPR